MSDRWQALDPTRLAQFHAAYLGDPDATAGPFCDWLNDEGGCTLADVLLLFHAGKCGALVVAQWCANAGNPVKAELVRSVFWKYSRRRDIIRTEVDRAARLLVLRLFPDVTVTVRYSISDCMLAVMSSDELDREAARVRMESGFNPSLGGIKTWRDAENMVRRYEQTLPASELTVAEPEPPLHPRPARSGGTRAWHTDPYR